MSQDRSKLVFHSPSLTNWFTRFVIVHLLLFLISQIDRLFLIQEPRFPLNRISEVKAQLPTEKGTRLPVPTNIRRVLRVLRTALNI